MKNNEDYYVFESGSGEVRSPYISCIKNRFLIDRYPTSLRMKVLTASPSEPEDYVPLIEAMKAGCSLLLSRRIFNALANMDIYKFQLFPARYFHNDKQEHDYWVGILENVIDAYDFKLGKFYSQKEGNRVDAKTIRLDEEKLEKIPLQKRLMFEVPGMFGKYIVHQSIAEQLISLNASGLHLVPLLEWDDCFIMKI